MLFVVSTPIGNLDDITLRAIKTLKSVDVILAEDTRHSQKLLSHYQINTKLKSLHEHNENKITNNIIQQIKNGSSFALISDAGTPLISDPGFVLILELVRHNIKIVPIPGVSALITALSVSGLSVNNFSFIGFLPSKKQQRQNHLHKLRYRKETMVLYESPKRVLSLLNDISNIFGSNHIVCLAKELTKTFETIMTKPISNIINYLKEDTNKQKGEFVIIIAASENKDYSNDEISHLVECLSNELSPTKTAKVLSKITNIPKQECYKLAHTKQ